MTNGYRPARPFDLSSPYGYRNDPKSGDPHKFHSGQDYRAPAGTPIPSATSGVVVYSGFNDRLGNVVVVKNDTGDYSLYGHMQDGDRVEPGQRVLQGDSLGHVGSTGRSTGPHLHYSIIRREVGDKAFDSWRPRAGGALNVKLNESNTVDPALYDNYNVPKPEHVVDSRHIEQIMSGANEIPPSRGSLPFIGKEQFDIPFARAISAPVSAEPLPLTAFSNPFTERFGRWGSVPSPNAPVASDDSANFVDRFGNWELRAPGALGNVGAPAPQVAPGLGRRSELPNEEVPVTQSAWPLVTADASSLGGVLKYGPSAATQSVSPPADPNAPGLSPEATMGSDNVPERRLVGRVVNLSAPSTDALPLAPDGSAATAANGPASPPPLLGIFSGKPMRDYPVRPSIFQPRDQSSPEDNELFQRWMRWVDG